MKKQKSIKIQLKIQIFLSFSAKQTYKAQQKMSFSAISPDKSWEIRVINNGEVLYKHTLGDITDKDGNLNFNFDIKPSLPINFARVELYNADGRCILLTNPIYLVKKDEFSGEIPKERIY